MITLLHPSRGRPKKAYDTAKQWIEKAGVDVEYILSIDNDDPEYKNYWDSKVIHDMGKYILHNDNTSVVEATNRAAKESTGDILVYLSDDFECFDNWGPAVLKEFEGVTNPLLIKVDDGLQDFIVPVLTIPIMNRALYNRLGYFWHPEYKSMFVDEDLYWTSRKLSALKYCPHLKFQHNHVSIGRAKDDDTYRRSAANWNQGKELFKKRQALKFPV